MVPFPRKGNKQQLRLYFFVYFLEDIYISTLTLPFDTPTLDSFVRKAIADKVNLVATDQHSCYRLLQPAFRTNL